MAGETHSDIGSGGMATKVQAARMRRMPVVRR